MARLFLWLSPLPLIVFGIGNWYVDRFEGWGRWAAAPVLLVPILLSLGMGIAGGVSTVMQRRSGNPWGEWLSGTLIAGGLALYFLVKLVAMEFARSF